MVPVLHAGTPHRVSLRGFERSHPQLVCVLIREMGSEARASLSSPRSLASAHALEIDRHSIYGAAACRCGGDRVSPIAIACRDPILIGSHSGQRCMRTWGLGARERNV